VEQQVITGRVDIAGGVGDQAGDALCGEVGADRLVVPQALRAQAIEPERKAAQKDEEE
jgi:hypothetical protein